jgi:hypothetical protein
MKLIALCLALVALVCAGGYAALQYATYSVTSIQAGSLLCSDPRSFAEAEAAVATGDAHWLGSIPACVRTDQRLKARAVECSLNVCQVRAWAPDGYTMLAYTNRNSLSF